MSPQPEPLLGERSSTEPLARVPEPELMDLPEEALAYARADFATVNEAFVERLGELARGLADVALLDLGTGPGDIALRIAGREPSWRITAIDAAPAMLELAHSAAKAAGLAGRIRFQLADAKHLPFENGTFRIVCSNSLLHHVADPRALWREARRVIEPGGLFFLRDLMRPQSEAAARAIVERYAASESELLQAEFLRSLLAAYSPQEVRSQLDEAGLGYLEVRAVTDRHLDVWGTIPP